MNALIVGATGYAGAELTTILHRHPHIDRLYLVSRSDAGRRFSDLYPRWRDQIDLILHAPKDVEALLPDVDVLFTALPHGVSMDWIGTFLPSDKIIIDLSGDFRLSAPEVYKAWYGKDHVAQAHLKQAVYGLPESNRAQIAGHNLIACPGCYPTASLLGLLPLAKNQLLPDTPIIIDAKSGMSGAGRKALLTSAFAEMTGNMKAYGVGTHRHTPEIEQILSALSGRNTTVQFTPSIIPVERGILSSMYIPVTQPVTEEDLYTLYTAYYTSEPFVCIQRDLPQLREVTGTNMCKIALRVDPRTGLVMIFSVIDNLLKGAAGQAVQNMNIRLGLDQTTGLNSWTGKG